MYSMERNINDVNREPYAEPLRWREIRAAGFFSDLTKKLVSSAGEKAASAIGSKAGEALGNKLFNRKKSAKAEASDAAKAAPSASATRGAAPLESKSPEVPPKAAGPSALAVEENKGSELVKLLQVENKLRSDASRVSQSNIHEIYNRLLNLE